MANFRMRYFFKIWLMVAVLISAGAGSLFATGGGGGSGGGGDAAGSAYSGWSSEEVSAAFGYQGGTSGGTIAIGGAPPPASGAQQGTQWRGFNQIPNGLPKFTKREWAQANVTVGTEEAKQEMKNSKYYQAGENLAQGVSIGCSLINGILSFGAASLGTEATKHIATKIAIYGLTYDGLTSAAGAYAESHIKGNSASKSLLSAASNGAAKVLSSVFFGKMGPTNKASNAAFSTVSGILYDTLGSGEAAAPNEAPAAPVVHAPMATPTTVNTTGIHM